jgi:hypothetical protein
MPQSTSVGTDGSWPIGQEREYVWGTNWARSDSEHYMQKDGWRLVYVDERYGSHLYERIPHDDKG